MAERFLKRRSWEEDDYMHQEYIKTMRRLANGGWGSEFDTDEIAEKELLAKPDKLVAAGIMEIVRRLNQVARALSDDLDDEGNRQVVDDPKPEDAKAFPEKEVGGFLFQGSLEEGFSRYVIVHKDEEGFVRVVGDHGNYAHSVRPLWGFKWMHPTLEEAIRHEAINDIKLHGRMLQFAQEAMSALESGSDLAKFVDGVGWGDDEDEDEDE